MIIQEIKTTPVPESFEAINKLYKELDDYFRPPEFILRGEAGRSMEKEIESLPTRQRSLR